MGARRFAAIGVVSGVLGVALLAGCGQASDTRSAAQRTGTTGPTSSDDRDDRDEDGDAAGGRAAVSWVEHYCQAAAEVVHSASRMPDIDTSTPQRTTATSAELLTVMIDGLDSALERLGDLGELRVEGAKRLRHSTIETYTAVRDHAADAQRALREKGGDAVGAVRETLDRIGGLELVGGLDDVPTLREASTRADTCVQLTSGGRTSIAPHS